MYSVDTSVLVDVVDTDNHPIGFAPRGAVLSEHLNFRTVHILLQTPAGEIVLQHLPYDHARSPGQLGSSVAGYVRAGEGYEEAARRKLWDELHVEAGLDWLGESRMRDEKSLKFVGVYTGRLTTEPRYDPQEIQGLVRIAPHELHKLVRETPQAFTRTFLHVYRGIFGSGRSGSEIAT